MIYSEPLLWQLYNFLIFFGFGFLCGFLFCFVEFVRKLFSEKKAAIIAQDVIFSVFATILMFVFLLTYADGKVRLNLIIAAALGGVVFFLTLGKTVKNVFGFLAAVLKKIFSVIAKPFIVFARLIKRAISRARVKATKGAAQLKAVRKKKTASEPPEREEVVVHKENGENRQKKRDKKHKEKRKKHLKNSKKSV